MLMRSRQLAARSTPVFSSLLAGLTVALMSACTAPGSSLNEAGSTEIQTKAESRVLTLEESRFLVKWAGPAPATQKVMPGSDPANSVELELLIKLSNGYVLMAPAKDSPKSASPADVLTALQNTPGVLAAEIDSEVINAR